MTSYVNDMQSDTLAGFPLTINETVRTSALNQPRERMEDLANNDSDFPTESIIYSYDSFANTVTHTNIIDQDFLDYLSDLDPTLIEKWGW